MKPWQPSLIMIGILISVFGLSEDKQPSAAAADTDIISASEGLEKPFGGVSPQTSGVLKLAGSRGEEVYGLIRLRVPDCAQLATTDFRSDENAGAAPPIRVQLYDLPYFVPDQPSYLGAPGGKYIDPMIPLQPGQDGLIRVCNETNSIPGEDKWIAIQLDIGAATAPGRYEADIMEIGSGAKLRIEADIWKMKFFQPPIYNVYTGFVSYFALLGHYGQWAPGEGKLTQLYLDALRKDRFLPLSGWVSPPPRLRLPDGSYILDLENHPSPEDSFMATFMHNYPRDAYVQLPFPKIEEINKAPQIVLSALENTIRKYKWQDRAYTYLWDEPGQKDYDEIVRIGKLVRKYAPSLKILVTTHYVEKLEPYVDIWVVPLNQWDAQGYPAPDQYEHLKAKGKLVWAYVSCMSHGCNDDWDTGVPDFVIDRTSAHIRSIGAMIHKYDIHTFLYWRSNDAFRYYPKRDPWKDQWSFTGNGDGNILYPGRKGMYGFAKDIPITSIRMKLSHEMMNDMVYYHWIEGTRTPPDWWSHALQDLVRNPTDWEPDYRKYVELRRKIGDWLNQNMDSNENWGSEVSPGK